MTEKGHEILVSIVLSLYIVTAVAFECTPDTARISTIGIYLVFAVGLLYALTSRQMQINNYCVCMLLLLAYVYFMTQFNHNSRSDVTAYYYLTCTVLCLMGYSLYTSVDCERITTVCLLAFIIGTLILSIRIITNYGGFDAMIEFSSNSAKERRIGGELINENTLGLYMANAFFCCVVLFGKLKTRRPVLSFILLLISPLFIVMLLLAASKKAILFLIGGFAFLVLFCLRKFQGGKRLAFLSVVMLMAFTVIFLIKYIPAFHSVSLRFTDLFKLLNDNSKGSESDQTRSYMISRGLTAFLESPFFGNGTAYSFILFRTYSHNNFVELLMNYGIVGFSIYYFPYFILIPRLISQTRKGDLFSLYFCIFVSMQVVLSVGWVSYYERVTQLLIIMAVGYSEKRAEETELSMPTYKYFRRL